MSLTTFAQLSLLMSFLFSLGEVFPLPQNQSIYHSTLKKYCNSYKAQENEIKASEVYTQANMQKRIFAQKLNWNIVNWHGNIVEISTNKGGDWADLTITSYIQDFEIGFVDRRILGEGGIRKGSKLYNQIGKLKEGSPVIFSGKFLKGERGIEELSFTERGSLCGPVFGVKFTNVVLNPDGEELVNPIEDFGEGFIGGIVEGLAWTWDHKWWVIIGIISLAVLRAINEANTKKVETEQLAKRDSKNCPFCAEVIKTEARVCRYCGRNLPDSKRNKVEISLEHSQNEEKISKIPSDVSICPDCKYFQTNTNVCIYFSFNVKEYPKKFKKKCDGKYFSQRK